MEKKSLHSPEMYSILSELKEVNTIGDSLYNYRVLPRDTQFPSLVDNPAARQRVGTYFNRVVEGLPLVTSRTDPNYDHTINERLYIRDAVETYTSGSILEQIFGDEDIAQDSEDSIGLPEPLVLPSVKHAMVTIGMLNHMDLDQLPYSQQFPFEARRFWYRELTVPTMREMVEEINDRVQNCIRGGNSTNYKELPVVQFFQVGAAISDDLLKRVIK